MKRPIALSCGDPSGVGPEIAVKAWEALRDSVPFVWIGDPSHLPPGTPISILSDPGDAPEAAVTEFPVLPLEFPGPAIPGQPNLDHARQVVHAIERGVALVQSGKASALTTAPISKKVLIDGAGFEFPGHTEFLAALARVENVVMMLASSQLRVVPATIHIPLAQVPMALTKELLSQTIQITYAGLQTYFGIDEPRVAIAGLNPHAGEGGALGEEETTLIAPLIEELRRQGLNLTGPHSADTLFHPPARANYDAVVAMYHDQALIPIKTIDFDNGVNVTLGLPFIRTSPDHGTAFDIAGKGLANPASLIAALKLADQMDEASRSKAGTDVGH